MSFYAHLYAKKGETGVLGLQTRRKVPASKEKREKHIFVIGFLG